ncbi:unnamed protein product, partial [Ectocarpus sp. 12 AP-2014]
SPRHPFIPIYLVFEEESQERAVRFGVMGPNARHTLTLYLLCVTPLYFRYHCCLWWWHGGTAQERRDNGPRNCIAVDLVTSHNTISQRSTPSLQTQAGCPHLWSATLDAR